MKIFFSIPSSHRFLGFLGFLALLTLSSLTLWGQENESPHARRHIKPKNTALIGVCEKIFGPSYVLRSGKSAKINLSLGDKFYEGDKLYTEKTKVHVRFKDGTYLELGEKSAFEAERIRFMPGNPLPANKASDLYDETVFRFYYGIARITAADVQKLEYFTVKTNNALVKVPSQADFYLLQVSPDKKSTGLGQDLSIQVLRGKILVFNTITNEKIELRDGMSAQVKVTGSVQRTSDLNDTRITQLKERTKI